MAKKKVKHSVRKSLGPLRLKLKALVDEANKRIQALFSAGSHSKALEEATRTQLKSRRSHDTLFEWDLPRTRDINREFARVQAFLSDYTSTPLGSEAFGKGMQRGLFGGQFRKDGGYGADPTQIDKETAERVFDIYHKAIDTKGGWERVMGYLKASHTGLVDYGSEELINAIYDMFEQGTMEEASIALGRVAVDSEDYDSYIQAKAELLIQEMIDSYDRISEMERAGVDYGLLESATERQERIRKWKWRIEREGYKNWK